MSETKGNIEKIKELHSAIHLHPFRKNLDPQYYTSYHSLNYQLSEEFDNFDIAKKMKGFIHSYRSALSHIKYSYKYPEVNDIPFGDLNSHIESCIQTIHQFILFEEIEYYYTFYTGVNIRKSESRRNKYLLQADGTYQIEYNVKEIENIIKEIEEFQKNNGKDSYLYKDEDLNYFKELLNKLNE